MLSQVIERLPRIPLESKPGHGYSVTTLYLARKTANCLTKNLLEMDSLPQIRNLLEMREISSAAKVSGGVKDEVNDERKKAHRGGHSRAVSAGAEEREDGNSERVW